MSSTASLFSAYASLAGSLMLFRTVAKQLIPKQFRPYLYSLFRRYIWNSLSSHLTLVINEYSGLSHNQVFEAAEVYLPTKIGPSNDCLQASKTPRQKNIQFAMEKDQEVGDTFENIKLIWRYSCVEVSTISNGYPIRNSSGMEKRHFQLTFHKKHAAIVTESYLPYVLQQAKAIKEQENTVKLYTRNGNANYAYDGGNHGMELGIWRSINLEHPATFETLAMEPELKRTILEDLDRFVRRKNFYRKVGKAWKRGYLLHGPPGTGKSSLVAAMANYLKFDVYDLELASVRGNSQLRNVLLSTTNRSILVIEDIDCSMDFQNRDLDLNPPDPYSGFYQNQKQEKVTLSGLLNFIDGLWSSCGDERIIVFTTNHKDKLDPALLRPGRMDLHIHLSYCTPNGFKTLASNYLGIQESNPHPLCGKVERLMETTEVTPAEVAEELMKSDDADVALQGVVSLLKRKKRESEKVIEHNEEKRNYYLYPEHHMSVPL
uniref:mitochondrial chaperone BCS1-like n=1 Tax=Fragaria vesca subsp. vesca TaxID=101020 RepID=UPI0005C8D1BE|nr:PREDICTED: mitochondrial chaperone BCS1-like [Fragaria vesca subsp. vesca]